ncbi:hypothetical protein O5542_29205, partial [Escherichia coli]|nr:hypothetical protein [Escherichia coli]
MSIKTSNTDFKTRIRQQIEDPIMRKAVANAQQRIGVYFAAFSISYSLISTLLFVLLFAVVMSSRPDEGTND